MRQIERSPIVVFYIYLRIIMRTIKNEFPVVIKIVCRAGLGRCDVAGNSKQTNKHNPKAIGFHFRKSIHVKRFLFFSEG
jgi:hypothetical protein